MSTSSLRWIVASGAALVGSTSGYATVYLTVEQARETIFPGAHFADATLTLTAEQKKVIEQASGVRVRQTQVRAWRTDRGEYVFIDEVLGKHEFITYALGLNADGSVRQVEIMDYRETYGGQVRDAAWRQQFVGKTPRSEVKLDRDIKNISGATLSSRHVTDGVRRLLATYAIAFKK